MDLVGVGRSGRVPRRTAGEPPVACVPTKRAFAARRDTHTGHGTKDGSAGDDELEGFPADGVGQGPRTRMSERLDMSLTGIPDRMMRKFPSQIC